MIALALATLARAGSLTGTVRLADDSPVASALVVAYDTRFQFVFRQTDASGAYTIEGLEPGPYRVRVLPPMTSEGHEIWHPDALGACAGEVLTLGVDDVRSLDLVLPPGGILTGVLTSPAGPVAGARVSARSLSPTPVAQTRVAATDDDGRFRIRGLPPDAGANGTFAIEVEGGGVPSQFVPRAYALAGATPFTVTPGTPVEIGAFELLPGVSLSGTVVGPDGAPDEAEVVAYAPSETVEGRYADGTYVVRGLPPGDVLVWAYSPGLATTYWPSSGVPDARVSLPDEGDHQDGVDIALAAEGVLEGRLVGDAFEATSVVVFDETRQVGVGAAVESDGSFSAGTLAAGRYVVFVDGERDGYVEDFLRDDAGAELLFTVAAGEVTDAGSVDLPRAGTVTGTVTDRGTGGPLYGAVVVAVGGTTGQRRSASTRKDGTFELAGLVPDRWALQVQFFPACPGEPGYLTVHYPNEVNSSLATSIDIEPGEAVTWDPVVPPDVDADGMDDVWESENGLDPAIDDSALDPDGDGFTNLEEFLLGTDPTVNVDEDPDTDDPGCSCESVGSPVGIGAIGVGVAAFAVRRRRERRA
jgi:hypothetical protein